LAIPLCFHALALSTINIIAGESLAVKNFFNFFISGQKSPLRGSPRPPAEHHPMPLPAVPDNLPPIRQPPCGSLPDKPLRTCRRPHINLYPHSLSWKTSSHLKSAPQSAVLPLCVWAAASREVWAWLFPWASLR